MPNHIKNVITSVEPRHIARIAALMKGDDHEFDFNRVIPQPAGMDIEPHGGVIDAAKIACKDFPNPNANGWDGIIGRLELGNMRKQKSPLEFNDEEWTHFIQCLQNRKAHGFYTWYEWNREHWGTKWNAYDIKVGEDEISFETAWKFPEPVMRAIVKALPGLDFMWRYADEDYGSNLGVWNCVDGVLAFSKPNADNLEEWAMRLHGYDDEAIAERNAEIAADQAAES